MTFHVVLKLHQEQMAKVKILGNLMIKIHCKFTCRDSQHDNKMSTDQFVLGILRCMEMWGLS